VHRDVSPQNLMIRHDGTTKLVDFGIAKASSHVAVTRTGVLKGKLGYFSPEQCLGRPLDRRSDVYALGIVAYEATTCMRLFHGDNEAAVLNRVLEGDFERPRELDPDYPPALEALVLRALAIEPNDRFATAAELQEAIEDVARALGLRLGESVVAERMRALFGEVPYPRREPHSVGPVAPCDAEARASSVVRPRRARNVAIAATLAAVLGGAGYSLAAREPTEPASATPLEATPVTVVPPMAIVRAASSELPRTSATTSVEQAQPRAPAPSAPTRPRSKPRKRSDDARPDKPAPGDSPDSMMPRG